MTSAPADGDARPIHLEFADNGLLPQLFGEHDGHLRQIERAFGVSVTSRGNRVAVIGAPSGAAAARAALEALYQRLERGLAVGGGEVDAAIRTATEGAGGVQTLWSEELTIRTRKRPITPRSPTQAAYIRALRRHALVFGLGPAGTGKTYLAVACAVDRLIAGEVDRIILSRPAVEAGERLGFLPGDLREKVDPYLRPLYDALHDMLPGDQIAKRMASGEIEVAPLAFMRGRTLADAFVILDEAQNTTPIQMKMFLTRLGENAQMAVTGDLSQVDLPAGTPSGLTDALDTLAGVEGIGFVRFTDADVVRHPLVARIVRAYDARPVTTPPRSPRPPAGRDR
ncbi:MAG: PhoH family protein [Alphaproteobacteria bacterium]|nr:PhoH family protein [Alphaproteobacteria bacterium]